MIEKELCWYPIREGAVVKRIYDVRDLELLNSTYDYILIVAPSKILGEKNNLETYKMLGSKLNAGGRMLLVDDNPIGLRFFNGSRMPSSNEFMLEFEEHLYTKAQWQSLLKEAGFSAQRFYYPYPDYTRVEEVFSEETINSKQYGRPFMNTEKDRLWLFNEYKVFSMLKDEGIVDRFASSFAIECAKFGFNDEPIEYVKLNPNRKEEFQIGTRIMSDKGKKYVEKFPMSKEALYHINKLALVPPATANCRVDILPCTLVDHVATYDYIQEDTLETIIEEYLAENKLDEAVDLVADFMNEYQKSLGEEGDNINLNVDLIFDNIFMVDGRYVIIDPEWCVDEDLPTNYVLWRMINELKCAHPALKAEEFYTRVCIRFDITPSDEETYKEWAEKFTNEYVGTRVGLDEPQEVHFTPMKSMVEKLHDDKTNRHNNTSVQRDEESASVPEERSEVDMAEAKSRGFRNLFDSLRLSKKK